MSLLSAAAQPRNTTYFPVTQAIWYRAWHPRQEGRYRAPIAYSLGKWVEW